MRDLMAHVRTMSQIYIRKRIDTNKIAAVTITNAFVALSCITLTEMLPFCALECDRHFAKVKIENNQITTMDSINKIFITLPP
jgi:protein-tyrosine phosphatase